MRVPGNQPVEGRVQFRIGRRDRVSVYKERSESWNRVCLKALAWLEHHRDPRPLAWDPPLEPRLRADLAALDPTGVPTLWVRVEPFDDAAILHACRHLPRTRIELVMSVEDPEAVVARIRKHVHYRYAHDHLVVVNYAAPLEDWLDPDDLHVPEGVRQTFAL